MKKKTSYLWVIPIAFAMPLFQIVFVIKGIEQMSLESVLLSLLFVPCFLLGGFTFINLLRRAEERRRLISVVIGFVVGVYLSIALILGLGHMKLLFIVVALIGPIPLSIGPIVGYFIGGNLTSKKK